VFQPAHSIAKHGWRMCLASPLVELRLCRIVVAGLDPSVQWLQLADRDLREALVVPGDVIGVTQQVVSSARGARTGDATPDRPRAASVLQASGFRRRCHRVPPNRTVAAENWLGAGVSAEYGACRVHNRGGS
jgi:hypothetical protein